MVGLAVVAEAAAGAVEHAQAAVLRSHPDPVARVDVDELDVVAGQRPRVVRLVPPHAHGQAVVAGPAGAGGDPDGAGVVAGGTAEVGGRQPLRSGERTPELQSLPRTLCAGSDCETNK